MLVPVFPPFRKRDDRKPRARRRPPPPALVLVAASYIPSGSGKIVLEFDRAIDVAALNGEAMVLDDPVFNLLKYEPTSGAEMLSPTTVKLYLSELGPSEGSGVTFSANDTNGIVAVDDGAPWPGVGPIELPFP